MCIRDSSEIRTRNPFIFGLRKCRIHLVHNLFLVDQSEEIAGLVERVTLFNEKNGFAVLRAKFRGQRDPVMVLGSLHPVSAGEWLTAKEWCGVE